MFQVDVDYHRVGVTREQIDELGLANDFNPPKTQSSRLRSYVTRTGGEETWELEALEPNYLQEHVRSAIEANMDMDVFNSTLEQERLDATEIARIRQEIADGLEF